MKTNIQIKLKNADLDADLVVTYGQETHVLKLKVGAVHTEDMNNADFVMYATKDDPAVGGSISLHPYKESLDECGDAVKGLLTRAFTGPPWLDYTLEFSNYHSIHFFYQGDVERHAYSPIQARLPATFNQPTSTLK